MLTKIQNQLLIQHPQLNDKKNIFQYYLDFEFPEKQRKMANWWEEMIDLAIRKSGQIYLTPSDLEIIFTINGLKPIPLEKILQYLASNGKIEWEGKKTAQQKNEQSGGWFGAITNYLWKPNQGKQTNSGIKSLQSQHDSKITSLKFKNEMVSKIKEILIQELKGQRSISHNHIFNRLKKQLPISPQSIELLLTDPQNKNYFVVEEIQGKNIIFFSQQGQLQDKKWLEIEKSKYTLRSTLQIFDKKIQSRLKEQSQKLKSAKQYVQLDKNQAKKMLGQVRAMKKTTDQLENRRKLLKQTLDQLQMNESDSLLVDIMGQCQKVIQKTMVQGHLIESVRDKHIDISISQKEVNDIMKSMENMDSKQIEDEVDDMMAELQKEISIKRQEKKQKPFEKVEHKQESNLNLN